LAGATVGVKVPTPPTTKANVVGAKVTVATGTMGAVTVTSTIAVNPPSKVVTDIRAHPGETAAIAPVALTMATRELLEAQRTRRMVALAGMIVATTLWFTPVTKERAADGTETPDTGMAGVGTVTVAVAMRVGSAAEVARIDATPGEIAVTLPVALTWAMRGWRLAQTTERSVALCGSTRADSALVVPIAKDNVTGVIVTPVTATKEGETATAARAVKLPSAVVTVIMAKPGETAVTRPIALTVAICALLLDQETAELLAPDGATVAANCPVCPTVRARLVALKTTPVTRTGGFVTEMATPAVRPPSAVVTVITAKPGLTAVTLP